MRVLMLGWEFPPHISGGLGTACFGLTSGLAAEGVEVLFVVPHANGDEDERFVRIVDAGRADAPPDLGARGSMLSSAGSRTGRSLSLLRVNSPLRPYLTAESYAEHLRAISVLAVKDTDGPTTSLAGAHDERYAGDLAAEVRRYAEVARGLAAEEHFDLIHAHDWMAFPAGLAAQESSGKPLITHVHALECDRAGGHGDERIAALEQIGIEGAERVVCVSRYTRGRVSASYVVAHEKLRVVHNGRPERRSSPSLAPTRPGRTRRRAHGCEQMAENSSAPVPTAPLVLFLGRLTPQKNPQALLDAAAQVLPRHPDARFVLAGAGVLRDALVERAARLGIARSVFFPGFLQRPEIERLFARASVFCLPSLSEPFGLAALEALEAGLPIIVSRESGVTEVVPSALRIDPRDPSMLARAILELIEHPERSAALVAQGQEEVRERTWRMSAREMIAVYEEVLA